MLRKIITLGFLVVFFVQSSVANEIQSATQPEILEEADLLANLPLFEAILLQKIAHGDSDDVALLLSLYQKSSEQDSLLVAYAQAFLAKENSDYKSAINNYHQILQMIPTDVHIRYELANSLVADKQYKNAKFQLEQLKSAENLSENERLTIQYNEDWLNNQSQWNSSIDVGFLHNKNINQAPTRTEYENWQLEPAKTAYGAQLNWTAGQSHNFAGNWFRRSGFGVDAKLYNRHDFDDIYAHASVGVAKQDAKTATGADLQYQKRWYGTQLYSDRVGMEIWHQRPILSQSWLQTAFSVNQFSHKTRKFLDGVSVSASVTLQGKDSWISVRQHKQSAKDASEAYDSSAVYLGIQQQWGKIGSIHSIGVEHKKHRAEDVFNIRRRDWRYRAMSSVWHDDVKMFGFVPSLTMEFVRNDSNHFAFDTKDSDVYFQLRKRF